MKTINKIKIANISTWIMISTICLIALFFIGFITSNTFNLNVFNKQTSEFIFSVIGFASVIIVCTAILNISLNIGIIADSKIQNMNLNLEKKSISAKFYYYSIFIVIFLISILFVGDFLTRRNEKNKLITEATDIINRYSKSIDNLSEGLTNKNKITQIPSILKFLSNQKENFPSINIIVSDNFDGQLTYLSINNWTNEASLKKPFYDNSFYKCKIEDCDYIEKVFTNKTMDNYFWTLDNDYNLYFPINKNNKTFILVFSKYQRYGKIGSKSY